MKCHMFKLGISGTLVWEVEIKNMKICDCLSRDENLSVVICKEWRIVKIRWIRETRSILLLIRSREEYPWSKFEIWMKNDCYEIGETLNSCPTLKS